MGIFFFASAISCFAAYLYRKTIGGAELQAPPYVDNPRWELNVHDQDVLLEALRSTEELIDAYRCLAPKQALTARPYLADCLINKSGIYFYLGRHEEALAPSEEAVTIYREICSASPTDLFSLRLAISLRNLGSRHGTVGHCQAALEALEESVGILRGLTEKGPAEHLEGLADSLNDLGYCHYTLGNSREALDCLEESVGLYRGLALNNDIYALSSLARSLRALGRVSDKLGRRRAASNLKEEAAEIQKNLDEAREIE